MGFIKFLRKYIFKESERYNIGLLESPSFLFFVLGLVNVAAMIATYFVSNWFQEEPEMTALITIIVSLIIFIIGVTIVRGFDRLLEINKMKTEFIRITSHQLRTPLSSMRWASDYLLKGAIGRPNQEQTEYLEIIREGNKRMIKIINDLLDVTKIDMGKLMVETKPTDLKKVAQESIKQFIATAAANNIALTLVCENNLPLVSVDEEKIKMAFSNLIDNAIKYTANKGEVRVAIKREGDYVETSVQDNGVGIPKIQQKNIFQKFFRSDNIKKHQTAGSGLGLFIVKAIIDAHRGSIWFKSEEGKGSTFYFKIPTAK